MTTVYKGKINFTKDELKTKYDKISLVNINFDINFKSDWKYSICLSGNKHLKSMKLDTVKSPNIPDKTKVEVTNRNIYQITDWIDLTDSEIELNHENSRNDYFSVECKYCVDATIDFPTVNITLNIKKMELMNNIMQCILCGLKSGSDILAECLEIQISDPEFILKAALFCRREFNVRTISNHLLALAASLPKCRIYIKKYFSACVNLPTDWLEVAHQYMTISHSMKLPAQLRKALVSKFKEFNTYQIGKYQNKTMEVDVETKKVKLTLKGLLRTLHISEPVDHVMCLLGKTYPNSNEEFVSANLLGIWDPDKAGKRMKVPTPETWETQISINGNKPEVWEKLIDTKKLPYMAMVRNLRNILQANVSDRYHDKVANMISQESRVINGKLLPFQYFMAFKILDEYNDDILKAKDKLSEHYGKNASKDKPMKFKERAKVGYTKGVKGNIEKRQRIQAIVRLRKIMGRPLVSENIIQKYTKALNKAIEISTAYNIPCIRGRVLILSNVTDETIYSKFKHGSSKSVKEVVSLLTSMCHFASEHCEIGLVKNSVISFYKVEKKTKSILTLSSDLLKQEVDGVMTVDIVVEEMITKQRHFDLIILFDVSLSKDLITKYTKFVNQSVSIIANTIAIEADKSLTNENVTVISGFSEHVIKIISEQSNGGFIRKVDSIDKRYNLTGTVTCVRKPEDVMKETIDLCDLKEDSTITDVNIFISSTFLDMDRERSLINKVIIPAVKRELKAKNVNFVNINCIDLRWGVPASLGYSEQLLTYCIEQVKRCHIFIGMLGTRYGWTPGDDLLMKLSETYPELTDLRGHSITHIEYKCSPRGCHKIFLLQPFMDEEMSESALKDFHNEIKSKEIYYEYSPENLFEDFEILIPNITKIVSENFVGRNLEVSNICVKHQRSSRQKIAQQSVKSFLEYFSKNLETQRDALEEIISLLEYDLKIKVKLHCDRIKTDAAVDKKKIEIKDESKERYGGIILVEGKIGSGRTSLMVGVIKEFMLPKYVERYHISGKLNRKMFVWFFDSSGRDATLYDLLYDMIEFVMLSLGYDLRDKLKNEMGLYGDTCDKDEFWRPLDINSALLVWNSLVKILELVDGLQVTFFLDGLEELKDSSDACALNWVPLSLPSNVRFVITAVMDSALSKCTKLRYDHVVYEIRPIAMKFKRTVINNLLLAQGKSLDSLPFNDHMVEFTLKMDSDKPKYLELAINHLIQFATFDKVKETIRHMPSTFDALVLHSLKSMESEIPKEICAVYFAFICQSRSGLRNWDLQKLMSVYFKVIVKKNKLSLSREDFSDIKTESEHSISFSLYPLVLMRNMGHLLLKEDREGRIFIKDKTIAAVIGRYCESVNCGAIHCVMSRYYERMMVREDDPVAYGDIIYHKYHAVMFEECVLLLTDIEYIRKRFELGLASGIMGDFAGFRGAFEEQWLSVCKNDKFIDFKNFVTDNYDLMSKNGELFMQQAINEPLNSHVRVAYGGLVLSEFEFQDRGNVLMTVEGQKCSYRWNTWSIETSNKATCVSSSPTMNILALGFENGLIQIYSSLSFQILLNLRKHVLRINRISFLDSSKKLVSVGEDNKVLVWDTVDGTLLQELNGHSRSVTDCAYCVNAELICTTGLDAQCLLWKQESYMLHHTFKSGSPINCVTIHNLKILVGCWNGKMIIYHAVNLTKTAVIHNTSSVRSVSINALYPTFLSTNIEGHLSIWNSNKGLKLKDFSSNYRKYPTTGMYSMDGLKFVEFAGNNSKQEAVSVWSSAIGYHENEKKVEDICCIDSDSAVIVCGTRYGRLILMDGLTFKLIVSESICDAELTAIAINPSKKSFRNCFAVTDYYCTLLLFEIIDQSITLKQKMENIHTRPVKCLAWLSWCVVSGSDDCSVSVFNLKERTNDKFMTTIKDVFLNSVLALDIRKGRILAGCKDKSIALFSTNERSVLSHHLYAHNDWVTCVRFLSNTSFVSGSNDAMIKIWEISSQSLENVQMEDSGRSISPVQVTFSVLHTLIGHASLITSLSFNNSDLIASGSNDGTIKLWQLQGLFADNLVIDNNKGDLSAPKDSIQWIKFHETNGTLLALESAGVLHTFNFQDSNCQLNRLTRHQGAITGATEIEDTLYTSSLDSSVRQWPFCDLLSKKKSSNYRIVDSLHISNYGGFCDVLVAFTDLGYLVFWARSAKEEALWEVIDQVDVKPEYDGIESNKCFDSSYLICECLKRHNDNTIDILFSQLTLRYQMNTKTFKRTAFVEPSNYAKVNVECLDILVDENRFLKVLSDGTIKYFVRIAKNSKFLDLFAASGQKMDLVTKVPLNGDPCHVNILKGSNNGRICFIGYEQGTVDFVVVKQIVK